jgi:hypothetical protein
MTVNLQEYDPIICLHFRCLIHKLYLHEKVNKNEVVMLVWFCIEPTPPRKLKRLPYSMGEPPPSVIRGMEGSLVI